ncbi:MAG: hypothetical protein AB8F95_05865 [Bacteroidia bacterium]
MRTLFTLMIISLCTISAFAQDEEKEKAPFGDRIMYWHGLSYDHMKLSNPNALGIVTGVFPHLNYSIGTNFLLLNSKDFMSLGINWGVGAGFTIDDGFQWKIQSPAYLMARIGAQSSLYNSSDIGFGLGIGGNFTFAQFKKRQTLQTPTSWVHPMLAIEYSAEIFTIRVTAGLSKPQKRGNFFTLDRGLYYPAGTTGAIDSRLFTIGYYMEI